MATATGTAPTEAEIRAYMESCDWTINEDDFGDYPAETSRAFENYIASEHVTDDDFGVFSDARGEAFRALLPAMNAALRPFMIEAQRSSPNRHPVPAVPLATVGKGPDDKPGERDSQVVAMKLVAGQCLLGARIVCNQAEWSLPESVQTA